jgi:hypothetical protein
MPGGRASAGLKKELINAHQATSHINWKHSGFYVDYADWNHSTPRRTIEA